MHADTFESLITDRDGGAGLIGPGFIDLLLYDNALDLHLVAAGGKRGGWGGGFLGVGVLFFCLFLFF